MGSKRAGETQLPSAIAAAVGRSGMIRHLIPKAEVEILDHYPAPEIEEIEKALKGVLGGNSLLDKRVPMTQKHGNVISAQARAISQQVAQVQPVQ